MKASKIAKDVAVAKGLRHAWTSFQKRDQHDESQHRPEHVVRGTLAMKVALLGAISCGAVLAPAVLRHGAAKRWHR